MKYFCLFFFLVFPAFTFAASPDGTGPWADGVVSSSQGMMKNGNAVPVVRSNSDAAVGVAEGTNADGTFFSLGFGGQIVLKFDNGVSGGVISVEATNLPYPTEKAEIAVSADGTTWITAGTVSQDGEVPMPESVSCARYVRLKDVSNKEDFSDETADGYDVDGVKSEKSKQCKPDRGGTVIIDIDNSSNCRIKQQNTIISNTKVNTVSNTGNNTIKKATGGRTMIKTGTAKSNTTVTVQSGLNSTEGCGCCSGCNSGSTTVVIQGNG